MQCFAIFFCFMAVVKIQRNVQILPHTESHNIGQYFLDKNVAIHCVLRIFILYYFVDFVRLALAIILWA